MPRWRHVARGVALVATALLLLHTPPARRLAAWALARLATSALGGAVEIGQLDYRLWAGETRALELRLRQGPVEVRCAEATLDWGPRTGLRARLVARRVVATLDTTTEAISPGAEHQSLLQAPRPRARSSPAGRSG